MSEYFEKLMIGLNEAIAIERGELKCLNKNNEATRDYPIVDFLDDQLSPLTEK